MKTSDFDYDLPQSLIAQTPLKDRSASKLLVLDRKTGTFSDRHFSNILDYLNPGDVLVLNETKVLPARIIGQKVDTGGKVELLILKNLDGNLWECLARPQKRLKLGTKIEFSIKNPPEATQEAPASNKTSEVPSHLNPTPLSATVTEVLEEGITRVEFTCDGIFTEILDQIGAMPLPPYVHEKLNENGRYQTVYAKNLGSAAAPTAGLHFTSELLQQAERKGIRIAKITLHVGLGTFRPVQVDDVKHHKMHTETYEIPSEAAKIITDAKAAGGRIIAVGTTTVRTLETVAIKHGKITATSGDTDIFIYPGYKFQAVDALITNFHLPKSTLLMLVSAFAEQKNPKNQPKNVPKMSPKASANLSGRDLILSAYHHAIDQRYRFFSFGDAMLII